MENQFGKPYQPSPEEVTNAEEMMTEEQKEKSKERKETIEFGETKRFKDLREFLLNKLDLHGTYCFDYNSHGDSNWATEATLDSINDRSLTISFNSIGDALVWRYNHNTKADEMVPNPNRIKHYKIEIPFEDLDYISSRAYDEHSALVRKADFEKFLSK